MGVFQSKIKDGLDDGLATAFGNFPTGVSKEKAEELWLRYDENGDGQLSKEEAKHMVIDLAGLTVEWAKSNIASIMEEANDGPEIDTQVLIADNEQNIEQAYKLMKDEKVIEQILKDFDTDGDGEISKEEFLAKATEGYDILRPQKKAKKLEVRVHETLDIEGKKMPVHKELVGPSLYVNIEGYMGTDKLGLPEDCRCLATIAPNGLIHVAGQIGTLPLKGNLVAGGIGPETTRALENIRLILKACGCSTSNLLKVNVQLKDNDGDNQPGGRFHEMNEAYRKFFGGIPGNHLPARNTVGCGGLAAGAQVQIDAVATN